MSPVDQKRRQIKFFLVVGPIVAVGGLALLLFSPDLSQSSGRLPVPIGVGATLCIVIGVAVAAYGIVLAVKRRG